MPTTQTRIDDRVSLRAEAPDDFEFLADLYASTREEELRPVPWDDSQKRAFLRMQFDAQYEHYRKHYYDAEFWIIERDGERVGRLYLHFAADGDLRIVDIALIDSVRGQGIGGRILQQLLDAAAKGGYSVSIHVERNNPAMHLYERLGFQPIDEHGIYYLMERKPAGA